MNDAMAPQKTLFIKKHQERCALLRIAPDNQFRVLLFFVPDAAATQGLAPAVAGGLVLREFFTVTEAG